MLYLSGLDDRAAVLATSGAKAGATTGAEAQA